MVIDPGLRLPEDRELFHDNQVRTIVLCARGRSRGKRLGSAGIVELDSESALLAPSAIVECLAQHGLKRLFIEGGGVTVSRFLEARALDRLHVTIGSIFVGARAPRHLASEVDDLGQALRPRTRRFHLGNDVLVRLRVLARTSDGSSSSGSSRPFDWPHQRRDALQPRDRRGLDRARRLGEKAGSDAARESLSRGATGFTSSTPLLPGAELARASRGEPRPGRPLSLLCHRFGLPSLVSKGDALTSADLDRDEQRALDAADAFVAPSAFMQQTMARLDPRGRPSGWSNRPRPPRACSRLERDAPAPGR